jgi:hypothetical protein
MLLLTASAWTPRADAVVVDFEDVGKGLTANSYWNGANQSGGFTSGGLWFKNNYNATWYSWDGWAYSNTTDTTTAGYGNQYSAYAGHGHADSATYGVSYKGFGEPASISNIPAGRLLGAYVTNTTYAALSMLQGDPPPDAFAKKFGGATGNDPDWFLLTVTGKNDDGQAVGTVDFYLADYRFTDNSHDYIVNGWTWMDLSDLGTAGATRLEFGVTSSDVGEWGMNTPAFFALDDLVLSDNVASVPEPATVLLAGMALGLWCLRRRPG